MQCPKCGADSRVTDSRTNDGVTRRTRCCMKGHSFITVADVGGQEQVKLKGVAPWIKNRMKTKGKANGTVPKNA